MLKRAAAIVPADCHTGVTGPISPLTQLLPLQVEMDFVSVLCLWTDSTPKVKGEADNLVHHEVLQWAFNLP